MGQIVIILGSMTLLLMLSVTVNNAIINKVQDAYQSESVLAATTMAQALIQEVSLEAFDENTISAPVDSTPQLTPRIALGKDAAEAYPYFDDLDDYKYYTRYDTIPNGIFKSAVNVQYVTATAPDDSSNVATFYKKISVTVIDSKTMSIPITLTNIISY